jgi:methylmalonyl-CoA/ethylmalonyl-CoA epimerase
MKVNHIGYFVDSIENAAQEFERLGFSRINEVVHDRSRDVFILFLDNDEQHVELIQPVSKASPVYGLRKRYRNCPYHICYETDDLQREISDMVKNGSQGYMLIQPPRPAPAIPGCPDVAFLINKFIGIIELVEAR